MMFFSKEIKAMSSTYTAVIKKDANWWIGWIEEVSGVNCQESSREKLLKSLRETLAEAIELVQLTNESKRAYCVD